MKSEEKKKKKWWRIGGNILFYSLLILLLFNSNAKSFVLQQLVNVGLFNASMKDKNGAAEKPAHFSFYDENGNISSTSDLKGKVVFINFWATWCPPCRAEMPSLQAMYNKLKENKDVVFLFINEDEDVAKATAYLKKHQYTFPLVTRAGQVPEALFSGTLPTTVVLDKEGRALYKKEGIGNYNTEKFIKQLKSLL